VFNEVVNVHALVGPLPHTPLQQGIAETIALFRERIAEGQLTRDALLY
jgi:hypothetical protein